MAAPARPQWDNQRSLAPFVPTPQEVVDRILHVAAVKRMRWSTIWSVGTAGFSLRPRRSSAPANREFQRWFAEVTEGQDYGRVPMEVGRRDENPVEIDITWGDPAGAKVRPTYRNYNRDLVGTWSRTGAMPATRCAGRSTWSRRAATSSGLYR